MHFNVEKFKELMKNMQPLFNQSVDPKMVENVVKSSMPDTHSVKVRSLYESWSRPKQLLWRFLNAIGVRRRKAHHYNQRFNEYHTALRAALPLSDCDNEQDVTNEFVCTLLDDYKNINYRWWYESDPKLIMLVDMSIIPMRPLEYIVMDLVIGDAK